MFIDFRRGGEGERGERNVHVRETQQLVAPHMHPDLGLNLQLFSSWDDAPTN